MKKKKTMILIITLALTIVLIGGSYAYFNVMFNDNRNEENKINTINTNILPNTIIVSNIADSVGAFVVNDIYPGHKLLLELLERLQI